MNARLDHTHEDQAGRRNERRGIVRVRSDNETRRWLVRARHPKPRTHQYKKDECGGARPARLHALTEARQPPSPADICGLAETRRAAVTTTSAAALAHIITSCVATQLSRWNQASRAD